MKKIYKLKHFIAVLFLIFCICFNTAVFAVSNNNAVFKIAEPKKFSENTYILNFLGSFAEKDDTTITAKIIETKPEKKLYIINKGLNDNIRTGTEFALVKNNIRVANLVSVESKENISALKLVESFPEVSIKPNDTVYSYLTCPTGFVPSYIEDPRKLVSKKIDLKDLFLLSIKNSPEVYEARKRLEESWHEYKYAQARLYPRLGIGLFWDTEFDFHDIIRFTWFIEPARNRILTRRTLYLHKFKYLIEKEKFDACLNVLDKYLEFFRIKEQKTIQEKTIEELLNEKEKITSSGTVLSPSITDKISANIKYNQLKLKNILIEEEKALDDLAISLGYPSGFKLNIKETKLPDSKEIYNILNSLVFIPKEGFKLKLSKLGEQISLINYYVAKERLYPNTEIVLGFPSLIGTILPQFPLTGKALKESTAFLYHRQKLLTDDIKFQRDFDLTKKMISAKYYNRLQDNVNIIISLSKMAMDTASELEEISNSRANYINTLELQHRTKWDVINNEINLIKSGKEPECWKGIIPVKQAIADLEPSIDNALKHSFFLKAAYLYKESVHPFLKESKRKFHKKTAYYEAMLGEREALLDKAKDEIKKTIIKNWIAVTINNAKFKNNIQLSEIAAERLKLYKEKETKSGYDTKNATISAAFSQIEKQKSELNLILSLLDLKKSMCFEVNKKITLPLKQIPYPPDYRDIENELTSTVIFHPESVIKENMMKLQKEIENVELAKKGWWVKGPVSVRYAVGLPGGTTYEIDKDSIKTKKWDDGIDIEDWLGIQFPISIFERTPFGDRMHKIRRAKIKMEAQKFKNQLFNEKNKMQWQTANQNLKLAKNLLEKSKKEINNSLQDIKNTENEVKLLKSDKLDLLSLQKLYILRKNRYTKYLDNYLNNFIEILSMGHVFKPQSEFQGKKDFVLVEDKYEYPSLKLLEMQSEEIEEAFRQSKRQNIFSWFFARVKERIGIGSTIAFKADVTKIRAQKRVEQMQFHKSKGAFEADINFAKLHSALQTIQKSKEKLEEEKQNLASVLSYFEEEVQLSMSTKQQVNELKDIIDNIDLNIMDYKQAYGKRQNDIKQLLGLPYYAELSLPKTLSLKTIRIKNPENLIMSSLYIDPELLFRASEVDLAQKEKKYTRAYREFTWAIGGEVGLVGKSIIGTGLEFWLFDPTLKPEKEIIEERENRFKIRVASQVMQIRKKIYKIYSNNLFYLKQLENQAFILKEVSSNLKNSMQLYKQHKIRWDGEYGLKPVILHEIEEYIIYMTLLENYHENFSALLEYIKEYGKDPESFSVKKFDFNITKLNSYLKKNFFLSYLK